MLQCCIKLSARRATAVTGGLGTPPLNPRATSALASPANHWGSDVGFLCNRDGPSWIAQWVELENGL